MGAGEVRNGFLLESGQGSLSLDKIYNNINMYIYIYVYIGLHGYTYKQVDIHKHTHTYMYIYIHTYTYAHMSKAFSGLAWSVLHVGWLARHLAVWLPNLWFSSRGVTTKDLKIRGSLRIQRTQIDDCRNSHLHIHTVDGCEILHHRG